MTKAKFYNRFLLILLVFTALNFLQGCKARKKAKQKKEEVVAVVDTTHERCRLDFKSSKTLIKHIHENEFNYDWVYAKANVESVIDGKEESFDIKVRIRKDSAMLI